MRKLTADEVRAERDRSGDGMMTVKIRMQKAIAREKIEAARSLDDLKPVILWILENM